MTTIAYRAGVLAADSNAEFGGWRVSHVLQKLFRLRNTGEIAGVVGNYSSAVRLVEWLRSDRTTERPKLDEGTLVIVLRYHDELTVFEGEFMFDLETEYAAWGSGMPPATAALIMGADAKRAVEVAAMVDPSTGGCVETLSLEVLG